MSYRQKKHKEIISSGDVIPPPTHDAGGVVLLRSSLYSIHSVSHSFSHTSWSHGPPIDHHHHSARQTGSPRIIHTQLRSARQTA